MRGIKNPPLNNSERRGSAKMILRKKAIYIKERTDSIEELRGAQKD